LGLQIRSRIHRRQAEAIPGAWLARNGGRCLGGHKKGPHEAGLEGSNWRVAYGIVFDPALDTSLSAPALLYAFTRKYHVPEVRPVIV
jgi:hypothetical protein